MTHRSQLEQKGDTVVLVGCVKQKLARAVPAEQLYTSALFRKRARFAQMFGREWLILSALHGVIDPQHTTAPYDMTLKDMKKPERQLWAERVFQQVMPHLPAGSRVILLAGAKYSEFLGPKLQQAGFVIENPLANCCGLGTQQNWLAQAVDQQDW
ncbi:hypothetical protein FNU79_17605 [Deinococcus detaillensis]|uniref:DUF6884 domain-containing protein n=1 Tax=Deinococcus detaillensis TaxID=2592048 RepID=A0A553UHZ3_9DEIO|nr:DUF6884 domain-containing protein [Deinococcus detaillensis]TSA79651.1 hypothetical protein FNU79_17605 [Deinococcus detaillensis]